LDYGVCDERRESRSTAASCTFKQREIENSKGYFWKYKTSKMKKPKGRKD
jgi:hypothetical protein